MFKKQYLAYCSVTPHTPHSTQHVWKLLIVTRAPLHMRKSCIKSFSSLQQYIDEVHRGYTWTAVNGTDYR